MALKKLEQCVSGYHEQCPVEIGSKDAKLWLVCDCDCHFQKYIDESFNEFGLEGLYELQGSLLDENCFSKAEMVERKINSVVKPQTSGDSENQQAA
jgi:hypothetical protein